MADVNGILAATVVSTIAAVVASVVTVKVVMADYDEDITAAKIGAIDARFLADKTRSDLGETLGIRGSQVEAALSRTDKLERAVAGMREEFDAMQTQLRILNLRVR